MSTLAENGICWDLATALRVWNVLWLDYRHESSIESKSYKSLIEITAGREISEEVVRLSVCRCVRNYEGRPQFATECVHAFCHSEDGSRLAKNPTIDEIIAWTGNCAGQYTVYCLVLR
jgi:hypothetical protein